MTKTYCDICQIELDYKDDRSSPTWKAMHRIEVIPVNDEEKKLAIFGKVSFHFGATSIPRFSMPDPDFCENCKKKVVSDFFHTYSALPI